MGSTVLTLTLTEVGAKEIFPSQKTRDLELAGTQCRKHIYDDAGVGLFVDDL